MPRQLSPHEIETLRQFENAALLRDLQAFPGWIVYKELAAAKIQDIRDRYENSKTDKDATWAAHVALQAVKEFQKCMQELVETAQDILHPDAMKRMIEQAKTHDPAQLDGELGLAHLQDEV